MPSAHSKLSLLIDRTSSFVIGGVTIFTLKGLAPSRGNEAKQFITVAIKASAVASLLYLAELSLLQKGNTLDFVFDGTITRDGFVEVKALHKIEIFRQQS